MDNGTKERYSTRTRELTPRYVLCNKGPFSFLVVDGKIKFTYYYSSQPSYLTSVYERSDDRDAVRRSGVDLAAVKADIEVVEVSTLQ